MKNRWDKPPRELLNTKVQRRKTRNKNLKRIVHPFKFLRDILKGR